MKLSAHLRHVRALVDLGEIPEVIDATIEVGDTADKTLVLLKQIAACNFDLDVAVRVAEAAEADKVEVAKKQRRPKPRRKPR